MTTSFLTSIHFRGDVREGDVRRSEVKSSVRGGDVRRSEVKSSVRGGDVRRSRGTREMRFEPPVIGRRI